MRQCVMRLRGMRRRRYGVLTSLLLWTALGVLPLATAAGTAGNLDTSFGTGGAALIDVNDAHAYLLGIQTDGKFVLGMNLDGPVVDGLRTVSWRIFRRNADGSADASFGTNGDVRLFGTVRNDELIDGLVDSSDRILLAGRALIETTTTSGNGKKKKTTTTRLNAFTVVRLTANGALDSSFGTDGAVHTPMPGTSDGGGQATALALQPDGKIVAAGQAFRFLTSTGGGGRGKKGGGGSSKTGKALALVRYDASGDLDASFGADGITMHDLTSDEEAPPRGAIGLQSSGKIVLGSEVSGIGEHWLITRYGADGSVDAGFGTVTVTDHYLNGLLIDSSDRILAVGSSLGHEIVLARYLIDGAPDGSFGSSGYASTSFGEYARGFSAALQSDGKIAVMCAVGEEGATDVEAIPVRFTSAGQLDTGFGLGGHGQPLGIPGVDVYPLFHLELDASGDLVVSGVNLDGASGLWQGYLARWCAN